MDFMQCLTQRRSVRRFTDRPIGRETLALLVQAASHAPSWKNSQPARYIAVTDPACREEIAARCVMGFAPNAAVIRSAPVLMVETYLEKRSGFERDGTPSTAKGSHFESFDTGLAAQSLCLSAWNEGIGSVILGIFDEDAVLRAVGVPAGQKVAALIALGYPAETPDMPRRKAVADLLMFR